MSPTRRQAAPSLAPAITAPQELALILSGTEARRSSCEPRVQELAEGTRPAILATEFQRYRMLPLLGSRLLGICPGYGSEGFANLLEEARSQSRAAFVHQSHLVNSAIAAAASSGVITMPLKGTSLASRAYCEPDLRSSSTDIDLLVAPGQLDEMVKVMAGFGYEVEDPTRWHGALPHYHYTLRPHNPGHPAVELHWRVHWYETSFAARALTRATVGASGALAPTPEDELALLLLMAIRDGYVGLRLAADVAAIWDAYEGRLESPALAAVVAIHPELRDALIASAEVAEVLVGVPAGELLPTLGRSSRRLEMVPRLVNWRGIGSQRDVANNIKLIDLLLSPRSARAVYIRHYFLQPLAKYERDYGWSPVANRRNQLRRGAHAAVRMVRMTARFTALVFSLKGGRTYDRLPVPPDVHGERRVVNSVKKVGLA